MSKGSEPGSIVARRSWLAGVVGIAATLAVGCVPMPADQPGENGPEIEVKVRPVSYRLQANEEGKENEMQVATLAGGCFWCTEAVFKEVNGVHSVTSGYIGGKTENPTYQQVCTGRTGHAEAIRIEYDPSVITYEMLLEIFFKTHDPTTRNRQGADVGTQYRSSIFVHDDEQRRIATEIIRKLDDAEIWNRPIVTRIEEATTFYEAEEYHQDYFERNPANAYCQAVLVPKLEKFRQVFRDQLKD